MRIALDATYSVDSQPSGIAVYSGEILSGLQHRFPQDQIIRSYRWKQWRQLGFRGYPLLPPIPTFKADIFHGLNQRVDHRPARRVVCTFHDLFVLTAEYSSPEYRRRFARQARVAAANSDLIIAVSHFTASQVEQFLQVPASRICVVPHGVHQPAGPRFRPASPFVLSVGALQRRKNTSSLVKAFESLPDTWQLVLAGSPRGYQAEEVLSTIARSRCVSRIRVTGYLSREALNELYASATIFAFPSLDEGFGIPVLEAMAYGVPVLTAGTSALKEIATDAALLVDPYDLEDVADKLLRLAQDAELRGKLAQLGKARSLQYSWERAVALTHSAYEQLHI